MDDFFFFFKHTAKRKNSNTNQDFVRDTEVSILPNNPENCLRFQLRDEMFMNLAI